MQLFNLNVLTSIAIGLTVPHCAEQLIHVSIPR